MLEEILGTFLIWGVNLTPFVLAIVGLAWGAVELVREFHVPVMVARILLGVVTLASSPTAYGVHFMIFIPFVLAVKSSSALLFPTFTFGLCTVSVFVAIIVFERRLKSPD